MARLVVWVACAAALTGGAGVARASPPGPPPPPPPCSFALSAPAVGGGTVSATVQSTGCAALAVPYLAVACLQPADGAAASCSQAHGADPAQVQLPYRPGVVYTASGRGCAGWIGLPAAPDCQILGPTPAG